MAPDSKIYPSYVSKTGILPFGFFFKKLLSLIYFGAKYYGST